MNIILNSRYSFRNDEKRIIIFDSQSNNGWMSFIHPVHAIILAQIGMVNDINKVKDILNKEFGIPYALSDSFINILLDNDEPTHVTFEDVNIVFPPNTILTSADFHKRNLSDIIQQCLNMSNIDLKTKRLYSGPDKIVFMLTNRCAVKCHYCYADTYTKCKELSYSEFCNIITQCSNAGVRKIELIGGDIFVKPDWDKYISFLIDRKYDIDFLSTKKPLKANTINKLINLPYSGYLQISLDSVNPTIQKKLLITTDDYINELRETFELLSSYSSLPFKIRISSVLCSANASNESICQLFNFIKRYSFVSRWDIGFAMQPFKPGNILLCTNEQKVSAIQCLESIKASQHPKFDIIIGSKGVNQTKNGLLCRDSSANYRCSANINSCFILPDGNVTLCERLYWNPNFIIGNLKDNSLLEIWKSQKALYFSELENHIDSQSPCYTCKGKTECFRKSKRCFVNVINKYGRNSISYPDPSCIKSI